MKKNNLRNLAILFLILFSLASYIYLNTTDVATSAPKHSIQVEEEEQVDEKEITLPDVKAIKAVIEKGKRLLPAS